MTLHFALVNGVPAQTLAVDDRGLHYGDGLFETLAVRRSSAPLIGYHLERLAASCARLAIPWTDARSATREIEEGARRLQDGVLKLIVTRGPGERGYRPPPQPRATRILLGMAPRVHPPEWSSEGVRVRLCATRLGRNPRLAGMKHLNRLEQVLARSEWSDPTIAEGLMADETGHIVGATSANVFAVVAGRLVVPAVDQAGIAGVMRRVVLEVAASLDLDVHVGALPAARLAQATELMLSNSLIGLWRVREFAGTALVERGVWQALCAGLRTRGAVAA